MGKVVHIVLYKLLRPTGSPAQVEAALAAAKREIEHLKQCPGAEIMHLGPPHLDARTQGYDWGLYSVFSSPETLQTYAVSEAHISTVAKYVKPNVESVLAYDFELP